jgi:hypothetical protein
MAAASANKSRTRRHSGNVGFKKTKNPRRSTFMISCPREAIPEVPPERQIPDTLLKQARKLRWMGLDDEANRAQMMLQTSALAGSILTTPRDTD